MIWTAWNNGAHRSTGAGYGLKIDPVDRDRYFKANWSTVFIELPTGDSFITVEANVDKESFWGPTCRELIEAGIGRWMLDGGHAPWKGHRPPRFDVDYVGERRFRVRA